VGREVKRLVDGIRSAGTHRISFDAGTLPSAWYVYRIEAGIYVDTKMMLLHK